MDEETEANYSPIATILIFESLCITNPAMLRFTQELIDWLGDHVRKMY